MSQKIPDNYAWNLLLLLLLRFTKPCTVLIKNYAIVRNNREENQNPCEAKSSRLGSSRQRFKIILPEIHVRNNIRSREEKRNGDIAMGRLDSTGGEENSILSLQFNRKIFRRTDNGPPIIIQRLIMILSLVRLRCVGSRDRKLYAVWIVVGIVGIVVSHPIGR